MKKQKIEEVEKYQNIEEKEEKKAENSENDEKLKEEKNKKKKTIKYLIYLLLVLIITVAVIWYNLVQKLDEPIDGKVYVYEMLPYFFNTMNFKWLYLFLGVVAFVFALNAFMMFLYARLYQRNYRYHQALAAQAIDNFYSSITPGAYGGEIAKVFIFNKQGVKTSNAASLMVMNFIIYQSALILIGVLSVLFRFNSIMSIPAFNLDLYINGKQLPAIPFWIFILAGFILNVVVIGLLFLMSSSRRIHNFVINKVFNFLAKLKFVKNVEQKREKLRLQVENYRIELKRLQTNIPFAILLFLLNLLMICLCDIYPLLSGLVLNGFSGAENVDYFDKIVDCIAFSNFHQMVTGLIPVPGGAGISEYVFDRLFGAPTNSLVEGFFSSDFYKAGGANYLLLLWRFVTFYLQFAICGIVSATYKTRGVRVSKGYIPPKNATRAQTMTMTFDTIEERKEEVDELLKIKENEKLAKKEAKEEKKQLKQEEKQEKKEEKDTKI